MALCLEEAEGGRCGKLEFKRQARPNGEDAGALHAQAGEFYPEVLGESLKSLGLGFGSWEGTASVPQAPAATILPTFSIYCSGFSL